MVLFLEKCSHFPNVGVCSLNRFQPLVEIVEREREKHSVSVRQRNRERKSDMESATCQHALPISPSR